MFSPKFKANPPKAEKTAVKKLSKEKSPPLQIIWTPNGASANPDQKRFRPINFSSPSLSRKKIDNKTSISPPWSEDGDNDFESFYTNEKKGYMSEPDQNNKTHHVDRTLNRTQLHEISRSKPYHKICPTILNTSKYNLNLDKSQSFTMKPEPKRGLVHQKIVNRSAEGNLSRALLKEQGYDSDSTIVFHKKADSETALLSPIEQRLAYRRMQAGGEPPLQGFRKTVAIEINKDIESSLHIPMEIVSSRKSHKTRPLRDFLGSNQQKNKTNMAYVPQPPRRKSSIWVSGFQTIYRKPLNRVNQRYSSSLDAQQTPSQLLAESEEKYGYKNYEINHWCSRRAKSSSPVRRNAKSATDDTRVAFGRKISREFTFAEEKKRLEEEFSKIYKDVTVSTRILKNPELKSNQQVKFALQNSLEPLTKTLICTRTNRNQLAAKNNRSHLSVSNMYANNYVRQGFVKLKKTNSHHSNTALSLEMFDFNTKTKHKFPKDYQHKLEVFKNRDKNKKSKNECHNYSLEHRSDDYFFENSTNQIEKARLNTRRSLSAVNTGQFRVQTKNEQIDFGKSNKNDFSEATNNTFEPNRRKSRSPSIRRIQSIKQQLIVAQTKQKQLRSRSLSNSGVYCIQNKSSQMDRSFSLNSVSQTTSERVRFNNFERFQELTSFYASLERIAQLEKAISQNDLRKKHHTDICDYNLRQRVRVYENAEKELQYLMSKLRAQQDNKNVFFQAQDPVKIRWNEEKDAGLRVRDKSVEDLKQFFVKLPINHMTFHQMDSKISLGRDESVIDKANKMAIKYGTTNEDNHLVNHGLSQKLLSSLSNSQKSKLINQLNEIYTNYDKQKDSNSATVIFNTFPLKKRSASEPPRLVSNINICQSTKTKYENESNPFQVDENKFQKTNLHIQVDENQRNTNKLINNEKENYCCGTPNQIKNKIDYFEHIQCSKYIPKTIYHARECSSGEDDFPPTKSKASGVTYNSAAKPILNTSQSFSDIRELFGESQHYYPSFSYTENNNQPISNNIQFDCLSPNNSENVSSNKEDPNLDLTLHQTDVHLRRFQSDSELDNLFFSSSKSQFSTERNQNKLDSKTVNNIKYENVGSPISRSPLRKESIYMPHINVISKTASLKKEIGGKIKPAKKEIMLGETIKQIKNKLEMKGFNGQMFASAPDIREFKDISSYLSGHWIAHQYPKPEDNGKSTNETKTSKPQQVNDDRDSGPITNHNSYLAQYRDWFSTNAEALEICGKRNKSDKYFHLKLENSLKTLTRSGQTSIQFRDTIKDQQKINFDDQINIHYKTPIRLERKEFISEDELMNQQADHMKKVYQDEKKRKHMQEIQNLDSRRHTDNFTPSQKSPISLNRYDDFPVEHTSKSRNPTRIVSRALYNFTGQSPRELTFKKSDLIYIRRKVDQNWYEGELHANLGLVPINYVEILSKNVTVPYKMQSQPLLGKARAKFTFIAQTDLELPLKKGELVTITRKIDDNWFEGKIGEQKGIFPVAYVEVLMMDEPFQTKKSDALMTCQQSFYVDEFLEPHKMLKERKNIKKTEILHIDTDNEPIVYKAMFSYKPQNGDELELLEGDTIYVLEKCDDGWYVGTSERTNLFGTFPGNYVKRI